MKKLNNYYYIKDDLIVCQFPYHSTQQNLVITGADIETFRPLEYKYAIDKNHLYNLWHYGLIILDELNREQIKIINEEWITDNKIAYFKDKKIKVDIDSLIVYSGTAYAMDKDNFFYFGVRKRKMKASIHVHLLGSHYIYVDGILYWCAKELKKTNFDINTAKSFEYNFLIDAQGNYFLGSIYKKLTINTESFRKIGFNFYTNGTEVLHLDAWGLYILEGADLPTFKALDKDIAKDKTKTYSCDCKSIRNYDFD